MTGDTAVVNRAQRDADRVRPHRCRRSGRVTHEVAGTPGEPERSVRGLCTCTDHWPIPHEPLPPHLG